MQDHLVVVDGYNLILRSPALRPEEGRTLRASREKLVNLLSWAIGAGDARFLVVFDGAEGGGPAPERQGRVEVLFARPPRTADDVIRSVVEERIGQVERLTVVTSDLEVARHARALGAAVSLSDLFMAGVMGPTSTEAPEKPTTFSKKEVEEWAEIFARSRPASSEDEEPPPRDGEG